jgi:hypothetical protein
MTLYILASSNLFLNVIFYRFGKNMKITFANDNAYKKLVEHDIDRKNNYFFFNIKIIIVTIIFLNKSITS